MSTPMDSNDSNLRMDNSQDNSEGGHEAELGRAATRMAEAIVNGDAEALRKAASDHAAALGSQSTAMAASIAKPVYSKLAEISTLLAQQTQQANLQARLGREANENQTRLARTWLDEETKRRDTQADRLYSEIDALQGSQKDTLTAVKEAAEETKKALSHMAHRIGTLEQGQSKQAARLDDMDARHGGQWEESMSLARELRERLEADEKRLDRKRIELDQINTQLAAQAAALAELAAFKADVEERIRRSISEDETRELVDLLRQIATERAERGELPEGGG